MDAAELHRHNGGKWFCKLYKTAKENIYHVLKKLPYAMTLETEQGNIGLVHAEVPEFIESWKELVQGLEQGDEKLKEEVIWAGMRLPSSMIIIATEHGKRVCRWPIVGLKEFL